MCELLPEIIDHAASRYPQNCALRFHEQSLSYLELQGCCHSLAAELQGRLGVRKGDRVGVYLHQSISSVVAIYGILYTGAVFVPIDPGLAQDRLEFVLSDCGIAGVISERSLIPKLIEATENGPTLKWVIGNSEPEKTNGLHFLNWEVAIGGKNKPSPVTPDLKPSDLAYIMYTSGSTGVPKGLMHTHSSGLSYAKASAELYQVQPEDVISGHSPFHFDISTFGLFAGPSKGACTVIIPNEYKMLPASLSELIQDERMTIWYSVTTALVELVLHGDIPNRNFSSLRWIKYGGEIFPPKYLAELMKMLPEVPICNVYGPAEVNQCTHFQIPPWPNDYYEQEVPLGRVWDNARHIILKKNGQQAAPGESGELLISSPTCMKGYWNRPALNEKTFWHETNAQGEEVTYLRTGDLVRYEMDGLLYFLGRRDRQIKLRGIRVELDDLEITCNSHPSVEEAAIYTITDENSHTLVELAIKPNANSTIDESVFIQEMTALLPSHAKPSRIRILKQLPRTGSGKIDRLKLQVAAQKEYL